jgi:phytoene dehydrogenase-like protein
VAKIAERAVVLGASMGGLLSARVLSDFYRTVAVVERDVPPTGIAQRRDRHRLFRVRPSGVHPDTASAGLGVMGEPKKLQLRRG